ncbi:hypothetical protein AN958_03721 [Leucoagaricus sp. SymC.cos]|nr:hypothetical protein AN958_03721 [Leucoagaricus sp. SymC.cos]
MSLVPRSLRKMRIIAVPLTRPKLSSQMKTDPRQSLIYYQFQFSFPKPPSSDISSLMGRSTRARSGWLPEGGIVNFLQTKAAETWAEFGKADQGSWKLKLYQMGERLVDRMEFEELALKCIDPSLGPSLAHPPPGLKKKHRVCILTIRCRCVPSRPQQIPLVYPPSSSSDTESLHHLGAFLEHRMPRHRRGFYLWMFIAPFTAPFMIIPVIPNVPFFFCVWRSWSHYKAYRATQYLQNLLVNDVIVPERSDALDAIICECSAPVPSGKESQDISPSKVQDHEFLLTREAVPAIISLFELKQSVHTDLYRAIEQARLRIESGSRISP